MADDPNATPNAGEAAAEQWSEALQQEQKTGEAAPTGEMGELPPARVLNQDEIDTLLGFDAKNEVGDRDETEEGRMPQRVELLLQRQWDH